MNRLISRGTYILPLTLILGVWSSISPFVLQTQPAASAWSTGTINNVIAGGILIGVSLLGISSQLVLALRELVLSRTETGLDQAT